MKKPPDVICIESKKENPYLKWFCLLRWAVENNDLYLVTRTLEQIKTIIA